MVKALLPEKTRDALKTEKKVLTFVKDTFVSESEVLKNINKNIEVLFDSENNNSCSVR